MDASEVTKMLKRVDPIWKRLRVDRFWAIFFIAYTVLYLGYALWARYFGSIRDAGLIWIYIFNILLWGNYAIRHFQKEGYWKRVGQRRLEAINDVHPFLATNQPPKDENALTLPFTLRSRWNRTILITIGGLVLVLVLLFFVFGSVMLLQHNHSSDILIVVAVFMLSLVAVGIIIYLIYVRDMPSFIELNNLGIRTRYIRQERFLRWDEVRIFARYGAQGTKKSAIVQTYEVSNEHTVVRWSQQMLANPLLFFESNGAKKEDWNWVIGRVNSIVASRTNLPLLDLSDRGQKHSERVGRFSPPTNRQVAPVSGVPTPLLIAQDDPLVQRMQFNGETGKAIGVLAAIGIISLLLFLFNRLLSNGNQSGGFLPVDVANLLLTVGSLFLILFLLMVLIMQYNRSYWNLIIRKRQEAFQRPENFRILVPQEVQAEQPLPSTISVHPGKTFLFPLLFVENFVLWLLFTTVIFHWAQKNLPITLLGTCCFALLMSFLFLPFVRNASSWHIELRSDGIATRYGMVDTYVNWNDARLFARYKTLSLLQRSSGVHMYELASEHSVVRWQWPYSRLWRMMLEPEMSREEFDRWLEQLQTYIVARTRLPLMDTDQGTN
jgi:hypothetical protein